MTDIVSHQLGKVYMEPSGAVVAGTVGQWRLVYSVGSYGLDEGSTLKLSQRFASDWQIPQFDQPNETAFTTVNTNSSAKFHAYYHDKAHERPWMKCIVIDVYDGSLAPNDKVIITLGDQSQGSPGIRAQTFQETAHEFRLFVDPTNAGVFRRLPTSPKFPIIAGDPVKLVCIVPTQGVIGETIDIFVKGEDCWGNPTPVPKGLELTWQGDGTATIRGRRLTCLTAGYGNIIASVNERNQKLCCQSNPMTIFERETKYKKYWGDLHGQTDTTVGTGTEDEYFMFGRDIAQLDFMSHQGNDFQMTDDDWLRLNKITKRFHQDGYFVIFPGYEWSGNTSAGGDRNVFYSEEGQPIFRSSHWQIPQTPEDDQTPAHPVNILFDRIRENVDLEKVILASHVGGRYADIRQYFDEELGPLVEILSCWGAFEWLLWDALEKEYVVGIICNSDGHKGRPGAEGPGAGEFGIRNGLTCVLAESLTRKSIFTGLKARRCYGTSGPRIDLWFELDGNPMGSVIKWKKRVKIQCSVRCTAPVEKLMLFRDKELIHIAQPAAFADCTNSKRIRVSWQGARMRGRGRRVDWDGTIQVVGANITSATTFAFDTQADGIDHLEKDWLIFKSRTTGDTDGIDLILDQAHQGIIIFDSKVGRCEADLSTLNTSRDKKVFDFGGLNMRVVIERYPEVVSDYSVELTCTDQPTEKSLTAYLVKVIQVDGHMAWSSPIYVK